MDAGRAMVERLDPLRHLEIAETSVVPGRNRFECDGIDDLVVRGAERKRAHLAHVVAIQVVGQRIRLLHHVFDDRKRRVRKNDVRVLRRIQEARPECGKRRLAVPGVYHFVQRSIFAPEHDANNRQHECDRGNNQQGNCVRHHGATTAGRPGTSASSGFAESAG